MAYSVLWIISSSSSSNNVERKIRLRNMKICVLFLLFISTHNSHSIWKMPTRYRSFSCQAWSKSGRIDALDGEPLRSDDSPGMIYSKKKERKGKNILRPRTFPRTRHWVPSSLRCFRGQKQLCRPFLKSLFNCTVLFAKKLHILSSKA